MMLSPPVYRDLQPPTRLRAGVRRMTFFCEQTDAGTVRREPPGGYVTLIISFGDPIAVSPLNATATPTIAFVTTGVAGVLQASCGTNNVGIEIQLRPWFACHLFGNRLMATRAPVQEISHLLPTTLGRHKRPSTINVSDTADLVVDWLLRLSAANVAQPRAEAVYAWRLLEASAGTASVAYLARAVGLSHRQFNAVFTQANGLKPKLAARLLRFGRFIELLAGDDTATLGEMAYVCGYSDQSHLTREAQALAAISPAALSAARLPALQGFEINRFG